MRAHAEITTFARLVRALPAIAATGLATVLASLFLAPVARAETTFGSEGSGAGQLMSPQGLALDAATGDLYVADTDNRRVDVFTQSGTFVRAFGWGVDNGDDEMQTCTTSCQKGLEGAGAGEFRGPTGIAVDNDPASPSYGDIYVIDIQNYRVEKFDGEGHFLLMFGGAVDKTDGKNVCTAVSGDECGVGVFGTGDGEFGETYETEKHEIREQGSGYQAIAVDASTGEVWVGDTERVQRFEEGGGFVSAISLPGLPKSVVGLALESPGSDFYIAVGRGQGAVYKYERSGALVQELDEGSLNLDGIAVDGSGHLFVSDPKVVAFTEYADGTAPIYSFDLNEQRYGAASGLLSFSGALGDLYFARSPGEIVALTVPSAPYAPLVVTGEVTDVGNDYAKVDRSLVDPEGVEARYEIEYVTQHDFEAGGFASAGVKTTTPGTVAASFGAESVNVSLTDLAPETTYHYRLTATTNCNPVDPSQECVSHAEERTFTTLPPLYVDATALTDLTDTGAVLRAWVDPLSTASSGYFEYVTEADYRQSGFADANEIPEVAHGAPALSFGEGEGEAEAEVALSGLQSETTYRYRLVATNVAGTVVGPEHAFTTASAGERPPGPDACGNAGMRGLQSSSYLLDCRAYEMVSPLQKESADILADPSDIEGKGSDLLSSEVAAPIVQAAVSGAAVTYSASTAFAEPGANEVDGAQYLSTRDDSNGWSTRSIAFPQEAWYHSTIDQIRRWELFSSELTEGVFNSRNAPPLAAGAPLGYEDLYLRNFASSSYVPLNTVTPPARRTGYLLEPGEGYFHIDVLGASDDLSHIVFGANDALTGGAPVPTLGDNLYEWENGMVRPLGIRENDTASTEAVVGGDVNAFSYYGLHRQSGENPVSANGGRVYWSDLTNTQNANAAIELSSGPGPSKFVGYGHFWTASTDGSRAFYVNYQHLNSKETPVPYQTSEGGGDLYEFNVARGTSVDLAPGSEVLGVLGSSNDGSYLYFVAEGVLGSGATAGRPNLYLDHEGHLSFIATLTPGDGAPNPDSGELEASDHGYSVDNQSVYARQAFVSADGQHLTFAAYADPTGFDNADAATGRQDREVYVYDADSGKLACVSCAGSGASPVGVSWLPPATNSFHSNHPLSSNGERVFFESVNPLAPGDVNAKMNVYEWEAVGEGSCSASSAAFVASAEGCVQLVSAGTGGSNARFMGASGSGDDVFLATRNPLVRADTDSNVDLYDARVEGGIPAQNEPPSAACEGDACRLEGLTPSLPGALSEASGPSGNLRPAPTGGAPKPAGKPKPPTRARELAKALQRCRKVRARRRRATCVRAARKRYGSQAKKRRSNGKKRRTLPANAANGRRG